MRYSPQTPRPDCGLSSFELYQRINPVAVVYGSGRRLYVNEHSDARRLLKDLWRIGRARLQIRAVICGAGQLDRADLCAFQCYLEHKFAAQSYLQMRCALHRFTWYEIQRETGITWRING